MKNVLKAATTLMAVSLMGSPILALGSTLQNGTTQAPTAQEWNTPPAGTEQAQQGFRDGIEAAKLDKAANRKIDAKSSHLYKNPPVKGASRDAYRSSFEAGYQAALKHENSGV